MRHARPSASTAWGRSSEAHQPGNTNPEGLGRREERGVCRRAVVAAVQTARPERRATPKGLKRDEPQRHPGH